MKVVHTSKEAHITEWELVYEGVLNIYDACTKLTYTESGYSEVELPLHHELSGNIPIQFNETVSYCILVNVITPTFQKSHNFSASHEDARKLLNIEIYGQTEYVTIQEKKPGKTILKKFTKFPRTTIRKNKK